MIRRKRKRGGGVRVAILALAIAMGFSLRSLIVLCAPYENVRQTSLCRRFSGRLFSPRSQLFEFVTHRGEPFSSSLVNIPKIRLTERNPRTSAVRKSFVSELIPQGPGLDYSNFKHRSQRHASLACTDCHQRTSNNSATPSFPGHKACTDCHLQQFVTPFVPMCTICHTDVKSTPAPVKSFPTNFKENFNVRFDHVQHLAGSTRPKNGCAACHGSPLSRGISLSIPAGIAAHNQCYACHTPSSKSAAGREIASCGVCHEEKPFIRTSTNSSAFRSSFSHAKHGPGQRLECSSCHNLTTILAQGKQVSSPLTAEHFASGRGISCAVCHNSKRAFGGDLSFKDCKRCHTGPTFRLPL